MIKKLTASIREYKKYAIIAPICVVIESLFEVLIPLLMANLIDNGIEAGNIKTVYSTGALIFAATIISLGFGVFSGQCSAMAGAGFAKNLRHDMFYNVQNFSFTNIDKFSTSSIVTRLTTDISSIQNSFQMIIRIATKTPSILIFSFIMASKINMKLAMIYVFVMPFLGLALFLIIRKVHPIFEKVFKTYDKLNNTVMENVSGIRVVKSFVREDYETEKFKKTSSEIASNFVKAERLLALNGPIMMASVNTCILLIAWFGAKYIVAGTFSTGQMMSMISYTMQILFSLMMLSMVFTMISMSKAAIERTVEILDEKSDMEDAASPVFTLENGSIDFENVSFKYSKDAERSALENINLHIKSGETVGIIGSTGSSKSTLVQLIARLYDASEGTVKVSGMDVKQYDINALRNKVSMVLQKNELFSGTIKQNLLWGNEGATDEQIEKACRLACAHDFITEFPDGYETKIEQGATNVSGGQKQRLCIARALLKDPLILILDDSTSAVDTNTDAAIRNAFRNEIPNVTKIIIAQRIHSVSDADKIIVMEGGKIEHIGTHEELLKSSAVYSEIYNSQMNGGLGNDNE